MSVLRIVSFYVGQAYARLNEVGCTSVKAKVGSTGAVITSVWATISIFSPGTAAKQCLGQKCKESR